MRIMNGMNTKKKKKKSDAPKLFPPVELTTFSRRWLMHTVYETMGVSPNIQWLVVAFHWVRVRVRVTAYIYIYII